MTQSPGFSGRTTPLLYGIRLRRTLRQTLNCLPLPGAESTARSALWLTPLLIRLPTPVPAQVTLSSSPDGGYWGRWRLDGLPSDESDGPYAW